MALTVKEHNFGGFLDGRLLAYWQHQSNDNNCGPFAVAMAANLRAGATMFDGNTVERIMESKGWKLRGFGVPAWYGYKNALMLFNPGAVVTLYKRASIDDLKQALAADKICIVEVSWQTDSEILKTFFRGGKPTVGHYMVAVGFNTNGFYFLDPGFDLSKGTTRLQFYFYTDFEQIWLKQPNIFIPPGTLFTVNDADATTTLQDAPQK